VTPHTDTAPNVVRCGPNHRWSDIRVKLGYGGDSVSIEQDSDLVAVPLQNLAELITALSAFIPSAPGDV
jgi:hypothetical protein